MKPTYCMILTTTTSKAEADRLAVMLVGKNLAACVQAVQISSTYTWQDDLVSEAEWLLLIKTRAALYQQVEDALRKHHSYETPEIICVPITAGSAPYLAWIDATTMDLG